MPIRRRLTGLPRKTRMAEFVFQKLYDGITWHGTYPDYGANMTIGACYDNETNFAAEFAELFPARTDKITAVLARLTKLMKELAQDGHILKEYIYNQQEYYGEKRSGRYPCYSLFVDDAIKIRDGKTTPRDMAIRWNGD